MNPDGPINGAGGPVQGGSREEAREAVVEELDGLKLLGGVRPYAFRIGHCDRCGAVIEPWLSEQWWCSMRPLAEPAIAALKRGEISVYPDSWRRETIRWLENIRDWNVSRQLWWGQRIPVWYGRDGEVVASKESPGPGFEQDPDVFDTWFSSSLWPIATLGWPDEDADDLHYFYPTDLLSTAREIMYLWVARMIMMGLHFQGDVPFGKVNVHSIVLAEDGTKMSKSRGNTIDPLGLFEEYGADAVRFGLLYQSSTQDFAYSYERADLGRSFVTKLWNATRFVLGYTHVEEVREVSASDRWILAELNRVVREYDRLLEECEFSEAMRVIYGFAWNQFADWYIEIAKAAPSPATPHVLREVFFAILKLLHPVMPFATEEMARVLGEEELLVRRSFPESDVSLEDDEAGRLLDRTKRAVSAVRSFRAESKVEGELEGRVSGDVDLEVFGSLAGIKPVGSLDGVATATLAAGDVVVEISLTEELRRTEIERLRREISRVEDEVGRARGKLSNEKFVERAPQEVVSGEREKLAGNTRMLETLTQRLE